MKKITLLIFMCFLSLGSFAQAFPEDFEDGWTNFTTGAGTAGPGGPADWYIRNISGVLAWSLTPGTYPPHGGVGAAFINRQVMPAGELAEDWLVSPQATAIPANGELHFWSKLNGSGDTGSHYYVYMNDTAGSTQTTWDDYEVIADWTETSINTIQNAWQEKTVLLNTTATTAYFAFVMTNNAGDIWVVDDMRIVAPCIAPNTLTAGNLGLTSADLSWANPSGATEFEIVITPVSGSLGGSGTVFTSTTPTFHATQTEPAGVAFTPNTEYRYWVRAICSDGGVSNTWGGPYAFSTVGYGDNCANPIAIAAVPYTTTDDTSNYGDVVEGSPGATGCGSTNGYLNGNDVFYSYTAGFTGIVSIDLTNNGAYSGVFVYTSCANVGVNCSAGAVAGGTATPLSIPTFSVTQGQTYYIVISTWATPQTTPYTLNIQQVNCEKPVGQTTTGITASSANLNWTNPSGSSSWQVVVQAPNTGLPTPTTPTITAATNTGFPVTATTTAPATNFTEATLYEYYVRAQCLNGTYSAWAGPYTFMTTQIAAPLPFSQNFETAPAGFTLNNGAQPNKWVVGSATGNTGNSLYISNDNGLNNAYTITGNTVVQAYRDIQMPASVDQLSLSFDWKGQGEVNDYFRVWVVPASFVPSPGTAITTANGTPIGNTFTMNNTWQTYNDIIYASAYSGNVMRLVFEWRNNTFTGTQPPAAIDNINVAVIPCPQPTNLALGTYSATQATFNWTGPTSVSPTFDYYVSSTNTAPTSSTNPIGNVATPTVTFNTTPNNTYYVWVRSNCGSGSTSGWVGPASITAPQQPASMDYSQDFEGTHGWAYTNGTETNQWTVGTATSNGGTKSLYITNDNGASNAYTLTAATTVHAYRDIQMPASLDQLGITFDWKAQGEANNDYFRVWLVPSTYVPVTGTQIPAGTGIPIGGNFSGNGNWNTFNYTITGANAIQGQMRRLVFEWRNSASGGTQPPAAIDNINFKVITCPTPTNLALATISQDAATFTWTAPASVTPSYDYYYSTSTTAPTATTTPNGNVPGPTVTVEDLPTSTNYNIWVRSNCGGGDTSFWIGPVNFNTPQIPADMPFIENFEGPIEWAINNGNNTNKWVIGTATSDSPTHSLYVSNDNGVNNNYSASPSGIQYVHAYRDVVIPAGTINANLSFRWKCAGESSFDYIRAFLVPITYNPAVNTEITPANSGGIQIGTGNLNLAGAAWNTFNNTFNVSAYAAADTPMRLVFVWRNDTSVENAPAGAVDNVNFSVITCNQPTALTATANATSAVLNWTPVGTESAWDLYVVPATGATAPTATTTPTVAGVTQHPYTYSPLASSTSYVYYVRAVCSDTDKSFWSGPFTFTSAVANDQCDDAVVLTVNPTEECATVSAGAFTGTTPSTQPNACTGIVGGTDVWYEFTALETAHGISLSDFGGVASTLAQQPLVLSLYEGDQCGDLTPLFCSTNNVISAINLVPGVTYKVRVSINAATPILTRTFNICVNTPDAPSPTDPAACVIRTINPSFSQPNIPYVAPGYPPLLNHNLVQGWRTTAPDQLIEFWPVPNFESVPAATATSGQFIEINANVPAGIYQDFDNTPAGTVFTCTFWHRKRNVSAAYPNPDVCRILAGDPDQPLSTYTQIYLSSTQAVWTQKPEVGEPTITYIVPTGQTRTRFVFEAVSTSSGSPSTGNFIDEVEFRSNNGIITANPTTVDCTENVVNIEAAGFGQWIAHGDNPSTTEIADDHANTTTISGFSTTGVYKYDWTTQFCTSTLEINYDGANLAAPVVTPDVSYCAGETPAQLTAAVEAGNTLKWYDVATDGTALADAPTPSTAVPGVTTYYVSQSLGFCEGPRSAITVTVNAIPAAPQADSVTYCDEAVAAPLTAVADAGNTLVWYDVATGGTPLAGTPTPVTDIDNSYTQPVITIYYVSQLTAAGCEGPRTVVSATVNPSIVPVTAFTLPVTICTSADNFSTVPGPGFTTGGYYTSSDATGLVIDSATGIIDMVNSLPGDYTVTYTIDPNLASNVCNAGGSTTVPVTIAPLATPVTAFTYTDVCGNAENQLPQLDPAFTAGGTFGSDAGLNINAQTGEINVAASTPTTYTVTYTFNEDPTTCTAAGTGVATIVITPTVTPVAAFNYEDAYCFGTSNATPVLDPAFVTGGTFTADNGLAINPATGEVTIAGAAGGIYTITYTLAPDPATCNLGASFKDTFTINGDFNFTLDGECDGYVYYVTATPTDNSYDPSLVTYIWKTAQGQTVGVDSNILNVTEYVNGTSETEVFPMDFVLTVINNGCQKSVTYNVEDISCSIQKGISPNNDGKNDSFELTSLGVKKLTIFNRYGKEVYSKNDYKNEWFGQQNNGNELPTGTYFYVIERTGENKTGWIYINRQD